MTSLLYHAINGVVASSMAFVGAVWVRDHWSIEHAHYYAFAGFLALGFATLRTRKY